MHTKRKIKDIFITIFVLITIIINGINVNNVLAEDADKEHNKVFFTQKELDYINEKNIITVGNLPKRTPMSFYNKKTGKLEGITEDILKKIEQISGLKFKFEKIPVGKRPINELKEGKYDLVAGVSRTNNFLNDKEITLSDTILVSNIVPVIKKGYIYDPTKKLRIAIPRSYQALDEYISENYPNFKVRYYDTNNDCLDAVKSGDVEVTMQNEYILSYLLQNPHYKKLEIVRAYFFDEISCIAASSNENPLLMSIINKSIKSMDRSDINQIVVVNTASHSYEYTIGDIFYVYRKTILIIGVLLVVCGLLSAIIIIMKHANLKRMEITMKQLKKAKEIAEEASIHAEQANEAKSIFLSRMSHEIRTPISIITGNTTLAERSIDNPKKVKEYLKKIQISSKHLLSIINDVLDMSAIENQKLRIAHQAFDIKEVITSVTTMYYNQCREKGIEFNVLLNNVTIENIVGDQLRLSQILLNLLSNALKFTEKGGKIKVKVTQRHINQDKIFLNFSVSDTGCGMNEEYMKRIFKPFEQEKDTTAKDHGGSGLGLSITKNLVEMMQGAIKVESEIGKGTTFSFELPFDIAENQSIVTNEAISSIRALVVDDDTDSLEYVAAVLHRMGIKFQCVNSGKEAIEVMLKARNEGSPFKLCLIDWKMPSMNGIDVARRIREIYDKNTIVIIISDYDINEIDVKAQEAGVDLCISKPIFQSSLFNILMGMANGKLVNYKKTEKEYDFKGKRLLLADDTEFNRDIAVELLEMVGFEVETAIDGLEAYNKFISSQEGYYDLILMDVQMPNMNGYESTEAIRKSNHSQGKTIKIIAMTANAFTEYIAASLSAGMDDHISKPIDTEKLYELLEQYLIK